MRQAICTSVLPTSETPVIKKIYHLNLYPAKTTKTQKRTKKELPNSLIKLFNYRHPIVRFLQKNEGLVQIKVITTHHDFGPDYKLH